MSARLVLPADAARTEEWYAARRLGITASEIAVVVGVYPPDWDSPTALYHRKRGELPDDNGDSDRLRLGRDLEDSTAEMWCERHWESHLGLGGLYASVERPWQLATPDRLIYESPQPDGSDPISVLELKSDASWSDEWDDEGTDVIPLHYRCQVLWQMDVLDVPEARVACRFLPSGQLREYVVAYDVVDVDTMRRAALKFLDRVERGDPPPIDWAPATARALKRLHRDVEDRAVEISPSLARRYGNAIAREQYAKRRKAYYENRVRAELGAAKTATCDGDKVATRSVYEVREHVRRASKVDKLTPAKARKKSRESGADPEQAADPAGAGGPDPDPGAAARRQERDAAPAAGR